MEESLRQVTRRQIYDAVSAHPGASARDVQRLVGLAWGETAYHLDQLTKANALRRERGGRRDYYFRLDMTWEDRRILQALRSETERTILLQLVESPDATLSTIRARLGISLSTVSLHLRHLKALGIVTSERDGHSSRYRVAEPSRVAELLRLYRESFQDRLVDRFVRTWSSLFR